MPMLIYLLQSASPIPLVLASLIFFLTIYFAFAGAVLAITRLVNRPIEVRPLRARQIRTEIFNSLRSILIFAVGMLFPWMLFQTGWIAVVAHVSHTQILLEMVLLVLWNDLHFYLIHRFLHRKFKKTHVTHHKSVTATPFTAYSMSSLEASLLGSVLPTAMLLHDFSVVALIFLPLWSILINTLAHSNCDFFPWVQKGSLLDFIKHHQAHHSRYHNNFSFFFRQLDTWLDTHSQHQS